MYQLPILKTIIESPDSVSLNVINEINTRKDMIFLNSSTSCLFDTIKTFYQKYKKPPTKDYLESMYATEKDNEGHEAFKEIYADDIALSDNLLAVSDLQFHFGLKTMIMRVQKEYNDKIKMTNLTDIQDVAKEFGAQLSEINRNASTSNKAKYRFDKETDARKELEEYYNKMEESGYVISKTSIEKIDEIWGGIQRDDMITIGGYTGQGKSTLARYLAYLQILDGKNTVYITTEMTKESIRAYFISMHVNNRKIWGYGRPSVSTKSILTGDMTAEQKEFVIEASEDLHNNPKYGILEIIEPDTYKYTILDALDEIQSIHNDDFPIHLLIWDYLTNMKPREKYSLGNMREEYNKSISDARRVLLNLEIPWVACAQVSRGGYNDYIKTGKYTIDALSDFNEYDRSSTKVTFVGQTPEMKQSSTFEIQNAKSRNTPLFEPIKMVQDPTSGLFHSNISNIDKEDTMVILDELEI